LDEFDKMLAKATNKEVIVDESNSVVIAEKNTNNLILFGAISNGNAVINLGNNKALKFVRGNEFRTNNGRKAHWVTMQILEAGIGKEIKYQSWNKTKTVTKTVTKEVVMKPNIDVKKSKDMVF